MIYQTKRAFWQAVEKSTGHLDNELKEIIFSSLHDAAIHAPFSDGDVEYTIELINKLRKYIKAMRVIKRLRKYFRALPPIKKLRRYFKCK